MPFTLTLPKLSPTMEEGTIVKWHKKEGDVVKAGDVLFEVATDKATVEYQALDAGWLRQILIHEGESAIVNQAVAIFTEKKEESIAGYVPQGIRPVATAPANSVEKKEKQETAQPAFAKASSEGPMQPAFAPEPPLKDYSFATARNPEEHLAASPLARKLAEQKGIDLSTVKGTGPHHRIVARDLNLGQPDAIVAFGRTKAPEVAPGFYEEEALTPMRKIIGKRLQESKTFIPHFYVMQEVHADAVVQASEQLRNVGIKISITDFVMRASALALKEHPEINSGYNSVNASIIRFKSIDISFAVTLEEGLITPIVRHADFKNLGEISSEIKQLAIRARANQLKREEYIGGSFTISNLGMFGVSGFTGIINPPQAALLCVGGIEEKAIVKNGQLAIGKMMHLSLCVDHRVIDGVGAAKFIKTLQKLLENPSVLLI